MDFTDDVLTDFSERFSKMADLGKTSSVSVTKTVVETKSKMDKLEYLINECRVETVVVYLDRAEVCRAVKTNLKSGENEVRLKNLSSCIDKDSIRYSLVLIFGLYFL